MKALAVRRRLAVVLLLSIVLWASPTLAALVALVRPLNPARGMTEAIARIKGELGSAGFVVEVHDGALEDLADGESRRWLEQLAARRGADAVIAVIGDTAPDSVEVWVVDKVTGKSVVRRIPFGASSAQGPQALAIWAVELLRASFLEINLSPMTGLRRPKSPPPPTVARFVDIEKKSEWPRGFGVELGGSASASFGGVGPMLLPMARFDWNTQQWFVQATVAGFGSRPTVEASAGSARVAQSFALLGVGYPFSGGNHLMPRVSFAMGALHTEVEGRAALPQKGRTLDQWSLLLNAEVGTAVALADHYLLTLSANVQLAQPYPAIRFNGSTVATNARPNVLLVLTIGAWL